MKTLSLILALTLLPFSSFADQNKLLMCELIDLSRGRTLERKQALIDPASKRPILLLMGRSPIMATVRDKPTKDSLNRKIELTLDYRGGSENSHASAASQYRLDQDDTNILLSEVGLNGEFGQTLSLQCFLRTSPTANSIDLMSRTTTEYGRGQYSSYCDAGPGASFCIDQVKVRAQDVATRDAEFSCHMKNGVSKYYSRSCNDYCSPNSIPPGSRSEYITCNSSCTITCEIP